MAVATRICGRLDASTCAQVVAMVQGFRPTAFTPDTTVVADYDCPPGARCPVGFGALVVLVRPGWAKVADLPAFIVSGMAGPERVLARSSPYLPDHIVALLPGRAGTRIDQAAATQIARDFFASAHGSGATVSNVMVVSATLGSDAGRPAWEVNISGDVTEAGRTSPSYTSHELLYVYADTGEVRVFAQG